MKKRFAFVLTAVTMMALVGCSGKEESKDNKTTVESSKEITSNEEASLNVDDNEEASSEEKTTVEVPKDISSEENKTVAEQETTTKVAVKENTSTTKKPTETTKKPAETTTKKPIETTKKQIETTTKKPVQKPTETTTKKPVETEAPIVTKIGSVDTTQYNKVVKAFESIVKKMRQDGIVKKSDVCVTMEGTTIKVDINYADKDSDLALIYSADSKVYELVVDYDFCWLSELALKINGKDSAPYNKELMKALLSMVTDEVDIVFNRIDLDCFSAMGLGDDKWVNIGDISIKGGNYVADKSFSYLITKEDVDSRDKSFTLVGKNSAGKTIECILEYDSSVVKYEAADNGAYMEGNATNNIFGYPTVKTGSSSYENYKKGLIDSWKAKGDSNPKIEEMTSHRVNGYTYYWFELFYETADAKGDPEVLYVQIGENEYLELYGFESWIRFEDFVNGALFIKEVKVK